MTPESFKGEPQGNKDFTSSFKCYLGKQYDRFKSFWNPSPEEQQKAARELLAWLESKSGFAYRSLSPLKPEEYPEKGDISVENAEDYTDRRASDLIIGELKEEDHVTGLSKKKRLALAAIAIPAAVYAAGIPQIVGSHVFDITVKPNLHPTLTDGSPQAIDVDVLNRSFCSVDLYKPDGTLMKSYQPTGETLLKLSNFSPDTLVGSSCAPGDKAPLHITNLDGQTYVLDMVSWASYLADISRSWYRQAMQIDKAHQVTMGSPNVTVAVVEVGFDPDHLELARQQIEAVTHSNQPLEDMTKNKYTDSQTGEQHVAKKSTSHTIHGTAVAGLVGGEYSGVAPHTRIAFIQGPDNRDFDLQITSEDIEAIELAVDKGVNVISLSFGSNSFDQGEYEHLKPIFQKALDKGIFIAVAAGNSAIDPHVGHSSKGTLARLTTEFPNAFLVQATDLSGQQAYFSQDGNISAPGVKILAPTQLFDSRFQPGETIIENGQPHKVTANEVLLSGYDEVSGTSFATPLVAGTIALALSINPDLKNHPKEMHQILKTSEMYNHGFGVNAWLVSLLAIQSRLSGYQVNYEPFFQRKDTQLTERDATD